MEKIIFVDGKASKELKLFPVEIQKDFKGYVVLLEEHGRLDFPEARKIQRNLFEIRVRNDGAYRGFYAYARLNVIVILHFFQKKTQKTPLRNIETANKRLQQYEK